MICPKCREWTFAVNTRRKVLICRRISCRYEEPVNVDAFLKENDVLPKLIREAKQ